MLPVIALGGCISPYAMLKPQTVDAMSKIKEQTTFCTKVTTIYGTLTTVVTKAAEGRSLATSSQVNAECVTSADTRGTGTVPHSAPPLSQFTPLPNDIEVAREILRAMPR